MARSILLRLTDMREALIGISTLLEDSSYDVFVANWGMQRAVERGLEIISEASRHIPDENKASAPEIPWQQIAAIGNLLRHEYQRVEASLIWNIVVEHLPRSGGRRRRRDAAAQSER
jgi:uncharacterized protein with HEPN domain